jgi:hypothetical protein
MDFKPDHDREDRHRHEAPRRPRVCRARLGSDALDTMVSVAPELDLARTACSGVRHAVSFPIMSEVQPMSDPAIHKLAVNDLLTRFFEAFDDKNWLMMRDSLCDEVFTDDSSFSDIPPRTVPRDRYVDQRRAARGALDMQHNMLNLRVDVDAGAERAVARCNYVIHRFHPSSNGTDHCLHSYGHYIFAFAKVGVTWKIARITQNPVRNHGRREIYSAVQSLSNAH